MKTLTLTAAAAALLLSVNVSADTAYEPSYLNYGHSAGSDMTKAANYGRQADDGAFEPSYVNYQFDAAPMNIDALIASQPTAAGDSSGYWRRTGHINYQGVYEPIYLDYNLNN